MDLFFPNYPEYKFYLTLFSNITKDNSVNITNNKNILLLNCDYVNIFYNFSF